MSILPKNRLQIEGKEVYTVNYFELVATDVLLTGRVVEEMPPYRSPLTEIKSV